MKFKLKLRFFRLQIEDLVLFKSVKDTVVKDKATIPDRRRPRNTANKYNDPNINIMILNRIRKHEETG